MREGPLGSAWAWLEFGRALERLNSHHRRLERVEEALMGVQKELRSIRSWGVRLLVLLSLTTTGLALNMKPDELGKLIAAVLKGML